MKDIWDIDPNSYEGVVARPYYIEGYWKPRGGVLDRSALEQRLAMLAEDDKLVKFFNRE